MWGLWDFHSCPAALKTPHLHAPPFHATAPTFPEVSAEAMVEGPIAGNFLWSAGNNLTWGLDSTEDTTGEHRDHLSLALKVFLLLCILPPVSDQHNAQQFLVYNH